MTEPFVTLAVLVGGEGRRMGGAVKPLLRIEGVTLLARLMRALHPLVQQRVVISTVRTETVIRNELSTEALEASLVLDAGTGPAGALFAAAQAVGNGWLVLCAGDLVAPSRALVERLLRHEAGAGRLVLREGKFQPQVSVWSCERVLGLGPLDGQSLRSVAERLDAWTIDWDALTSEERGGLVGVNSREEAEALGVDLPA